MKNLTTKLMFAAVAFTGFAQMASAQSMEAKIPFTFRAGGKVFAPGTYRVDMHRRASGYQLIVLSDTQHKNVALSIGLDTGEANKAWRDAGEPVLAFECGISRCALRTVWNGDDGSPAYRLAVPSLGKDEPSHVAAVPMIRVKGE